MKKVAGSGHFLITSLLVFVLFVSSLGVGLSLRAGETTRENPSSKSTEAAAWPDSPPWPLGFVQMATGSYAEHTLGITSDGDLYAWGYNNYGQIGNGSSGTNVLSPYLIPNSVKYKAAAVGWIHSLAIAENGDLYSWGNNSYGQIGDGSSGYNVPSLYPITNGVKYKAVATGQTHSLAIAENGDLYAWGNNSYGQIGDGSSGTNVLSPYLIPNSVKYKAVAAGAHHSLAIAENGDLYAWGQDTYGQIGNGSSDTDVLSPCLISNSIKYKAVAAGLVHSLAIAENGDLYAWGNNGAGQIGNGSSGGNILSPYLIPNGIKHKAVAAGRVHSLAIAENGDLYAWGNNSYGQIGNGSSGGNVLSPYLISNSIKYKSVAAGHYHFLAIAESDVLYAWGWNEYGQIGNGSSSSSFYITSPCLIAWMPHRLEFVQVAQGSNANHTLGMIKDGDLYAWGYNQYGQIGNGSYSSANYVKIPTLISGGVKYKAVAAGSNHSLAIAQNGDLYAWGYNASGQIGNGSNSFIDYVLSPYRIPNGVKYKAVAAGNNHSLAIAENGDMYAWGNSYYGQIGNGSSGSNTNVLSPYKIPNGIKYKAVATGTFHSLAIAENGDLYAWGSNGKGQIGNNKNNGVSVASPYLIPNGVKYTSVAAGNSHSLAIAENGDLYAWGHNYYGQIGNGLRGDTENVFTPIHIPNGSRKYKAVAAGYNHSLAIAENGDLYVWGNNDCAQIGNGTSGSAITDLILSPYLIHNDIEYKVVAAGYNHSLAIAENGSLYAWGSNSYGQIGNGSSSTIIYVTLPKLIASPPPFYSVVTSFSSVSSALSRISVDGQMFIIGCNLEIENSGEVLIVFQALTRILQINIDIGGEVVVLTSFNVERDIGGALFEFSSTDARQVSTTITNITRDVTIVCTTENSWQIECIDEYNETTLVDVSTSYAALANPAVIPDGKVFAGWWTKSGTDGDWGIQMTAATEFSNITNWDSVERITRVYAKWI